MKWKMDSLKGCEEILDSPKSFRPWCISYETFISLYSGIINPYPSNLRKTTFLLNGFFIFILKLTNAQHFKTQLPLETEKNRKIVVVWPVRIRTLEEVKIIKNITKIGSVL